MAHFDVVPASLDTGGVTVVSLTRSEARRLESLGSELEPHHRSPNSHSRIYTERAKIELTLLALKDNAPTPIHYDQQRVDTAVAWYHQNMPQRVTVNDMADVVHVSVCAPAQVVYPIPPETATDGDETIAD